MPCTCMTAPYAPTDDDDDDDVRVREGNYLMNQMFVMGITKYM